MSFFTAPYADRGYYSGASIDPAVLAELQQQQWGLGNNSYAVGGQIYSPVYDNGVQKSGEDASGYTPTLTGYSSMAQGATPGGNYTTYDLKGNGGYSHPILNGGSFNMGDFKDLQQAVATMAVMYGLGAGMGALGAGSAGGGAAGAGLGAEVDPMMYGGTGASTWGAGSTAGAVGGAGVTGLPGGTEADLMYGGGADGGATLGGGAGAGTAATSAIPSASGVASSASSLIPSGVSSLLGPAASILGAVAGSQGQKQTTTQTRDIPEWLKPYVTGQGGLLDSTNSLMRQQMGYVPQQAQQISNTGMGLLSQPIAGNGVAQFNQRPRFGGY